MEFGDRDPEQRKKKCPLKKHTNEREIVWVYDGRIWSEMKGDGIKKRKKKENWSVKTSWRRKTEEEIAVTEENSNATLG